MFRFDERCRLSNAYENRQCSENSIRFECRKKSTAKKKKKRNKDHHRNGDKQKKIILISRRKCTRNLRRSSVRRSKRLCERESVSRPCVGVQPHVCVLGTSHTVCRLPLADLKPTRRRHTHTHVPKSTRPRKRVYAQTLSVSVYHHICSVFYWLVSVCVWVCLCVCLASAYDKQRTGSMSLSYRDQIQRQ